MHFSNCGLRPNITLVSEETQNIIKNHINIISLLIQLAEFEQHQFQKVRFWDSECQRRKSFTSRNLWGKKIWVRNSLKFRKAALHLFRLFVHLVQYSLLHWFPVFLVWQPTSPKLLTMVTHQIIVTRILGPRSLAASLLCILCTTTLPLLSSWS